MLTEVNVRSKKHSLSDLIQIQTGGEGIVFEFGSDEALKLYHQLNPRRNAKLVDFLKAGFNLPSRVFSPLELAYAKDGAIAGFVMRRLPAGAQPISMLFSRKTLEKHGIGMKGTIIAFMEMHRDLVLIHSQRLVVGDLNDRNERIHPQRLEAGMGWLDVDSWQFGPYPCAVATKEYVHPGLLGKDLSLRPQFEAEHDWFSFAVLLFRAIFLAHPFKSGFHEKFLGMTQRAKNGVTFLDRGVVYPQMAQPAEVATDGIVSALLAHLKQASSGQFPADVIEEYGRIIMQCNKCGIWYPANRSKCPGCAATTMMDAQLAEAILGWQHESVIVTGGKIIYFQVVGTTLYCLANEQGQTVLYRKAKGKDAERIELFATVNGAQYRIFGNYLAVCPDPYGPEAAVYILNISRGQANALCTTTTKPLAGRRALLSSSALFLYRVVGSRLKRCQRFGSTSMLEERDVMKVIPGQTWFTACSNPPKGKEYVIGFHRVFGELKWFLVEMDLESGATVQRSVDIAPLKKRESFIDLSIKFGKKSVAVLIKSRLGGIDYVNAHIVSMSDGTVIKTVRTEEPDDIGFHGKAYSDGFLTHPSDAGLVREDVEKGGVQTLKRTEKLVKGDDNLYHYEGGILAVKDGSVIYLYQPKAKTVSA